MLISIMGAWQIYEEYYKLQTELAAMDEKLISSYKELIKTEVGKAVSYIEYHKSLLNDRLNQSIKGRVYEAHAIADNIYKQYNKTKNVAEIELMIKDALRPIRFNNGRGYYFAFNLQGIEQLFADRPEMEGKNMLAVQGAKGEYVVRDMISVVNRNREGFYEYTWTKPNQKGYFSKRAYIKLFEPLGWVFGTGEYVDDTQKDIQNEVISFIEQSKFGKDGYIFAGQWDGISLSGPAKGRNMLEITDSNGVKIVQEMVNIAKKGSGYFEYVMPKLEDKNPSPKLSYLMGVPEWKWYIGAGIYIDEIEKSIEQKRIIIEQTIIEQIVNIVTILGLLVFAVYIIALYISRKVIINIDQFMGFFEKASIELIEINPDEMDFVEIESMAHSANKMINARKSAEEALRQSEERYRHIVENAPVGIFQTGFDGKYYYVNPALMKHCECASLKEFITKYSNETRSVVYDDQKREELKELLFRDGKVEAYELKSILNSGNIKWSSIYAYLDIDMEMINGFSLDITARKTAEEEREKLQSQLLQIQKMESIGRLAGGVAHDFNNMLSVILGYSELALRKIDFNHQLYKNLSEIRNAAERSANLTRQLLAFARKQAVNPKVLDLNATIEGMLKMVERLIGEDIELRWFPDPELWKVKMDPSQVDQIIANLCVNARDAISGSGKVIIETKNNILDTKYCSVHSDFLPGEYACIIVSDTGSGMDKETIQKIFEPFFTTKDVGAGTGLGLATVYGIVKQNNGFINVYSEPDNGTSFIIYIPRNTSEDVNIVSNKQIKISGANNETVLVVDDEEGILNIAKDILEIHGYRVLTANTSAKALYLVEKYSGKIDLLIIDVVMPEKSGKELAQLIQSKQPNIKCMFISGYTASVIEHKGVLDKGIQFMQKPFSINQLAVKVREVLDQNPSINFTDIKSNLDIINKNGQQELIGLTGGIAGGKTTVAEMFRQCGAQIIDFDTLAREAVEPGTKSFNNIVSHFGPGILDKNGYLDRNALSKIVFKDKQKRRELEKLTHPAIFKLFCDKVNYYNTNKRDFDGLNSLNSPDNRDNPDNSKSPDDSKSAKRVIIAVIPLMIEMNLQNLFDKIVIIYLSSESQLKRLMQRENIDEDRAASMIKSQLPIDDKIQYADFIIDNSGDLENTLKQVKNVWKKL
ncbi:MAG: dephospho-CoA kinase [Desulfamplus sp.]